MKEGRNVIIGIETAVNGGSVSLVENREEIDWIAGTEQISKSEDILSGLDRLLNKNHLGRCHIEQICVSKGPGSLTGIRIGTATAFGVGNALQKDVFEISIFDAMRINNFYPSRVITAFNSGKSGIYFKEHSENNFGDQLNQTAMLPISLGKFVAEMRAFARDSDITLVWTDDLFEMVEREVSDQDYLGGWNIVKVGGSLAGMIAMALDRNNASDNEL